MKRNNIINIIKKNKNLFIIIKSLAAIGLITAIVAVSAHYLTGETLAEYAEANPELAYGTSDTSAESKSDVVLASPGESTASEPVTAVISDSIEEESTETQSSVPEPSTGAIDDSPEQVAIEEQSNNSESPADVNDSIDSESIDTQSSNIPEVHISNMIHFYDMSSLSSENISDSRTLYQPGFYYEPLSSDVNDYITGSSMPTDIVNPAVTYDDLSYVGILYIDFNGLCQAGELICNKALAKDFVEIFYELYQADYRLEKVVLVDNYGADDTASMSANNTSCFNYRVVDNSTNLSNHAYGRAIDINPFYNPYIVFGANPDGTDYISPSGSEIYADRSQSFAYKIDENDLCYRLFKEHGFTWGGNWNSCKDYQHFQKKE